MAVCRRCRTIWSIRTKFFVLFIIISPISCLSDPYKTLGVTRTATMQEIKRAYKHLAREWHPDKNQDPEAESKFIEINEAYELLSDPERRREYDLHGITENIPSLRQKHDYSQFRHFDSFFSGDSFQFSFNFNEGSIFHRLSITHKAFETTILPNSVKQPYLILFYSDWCLPCMQLEPVWKRIMEELEPIGMGIATVHSEHEKMLTKKFSIGSRPYLVMAIDGKVLHYREPQISLNRVIEFSKRKFPFKTVSFVNDDNSDAFLTSWIIDNRIRVLFFGRQDAIRLRYYLVAFQQKEHATSGYVRLGAPETEKICARYGVSPNYETMLVFNENFDTPIASLSMADIPTPTMHDVINANKFLILPRLSSQSMFDQLCPPEASRSRKRLCVILVTQNTPDHEMYRSAMREYIKNFAPKTDRVHFAYIFEEKQTDFINALNQNGNSPDTTALHVVIIWRIDLKNLKYEWVDTKWNIEANRINETQELLRNTIHRLLHAKEVLSYDAVIQELVDEHAQSIFMRIFTKLFLMAEFLQETFTREEAIPVISIICTIAFIAGGGYIMSYLVKLEEESIRERYRKMGKEFPSKKSKGSGSKPNEVQLKIHELKADTYNALVKMLKPGCRTIVLLVDEESEAMLLPKFHKHCYPYRKNKTLMFAYLRLGRYLEWYRRILIQTLPEPRDLTINPRNCVGTVLSINGLRRYFCMYHAKHQETYRGAKGGKGPGFIGFDDSTDSETEASDVEAARNMQHINGSTVLIDNLLDGLPNWLDRLFEGSTQRYYIQLWPMMK